MKIQNRNWSCPRNANKDLVKALTDMGMKVGELKAQKECMEKDRKKELEDQKEKCNRKIQDLEAQIEQLSKPKGLVKTALSLISIEKYVVKHKSAKLL